MGSTKTDSYLFMLRLQICTATSSYPEDAILQLPLWSILISIFPEYFSMLRLRCGTKERKSNTSGLNIHLHTRIPTYSKFRMCPYLLQLYGVKIMSYWIMASPNQHGLKTQIREVQRPRHQVRSEQFNKTIPDTNKSREKGKLYIFQCYRTPFLVWSFPTFFPSHI